MITTYGIANALLISHLSCIDAPASASDIKPHTDDERNERKNAMLLFKEVAITSVLEAMIPCSLNERAKTSQTQQFSDELARKKMKQWVHRMHIHIYVYIYTYACTSRRAPDAKTP